MRPLLIAQIFATAGLAIGASTVHAQDPALRPDETVRPSNTIPRFELSLGYNHVSANSPPSGCKCFEMNGAYASADYYIQNWLSITAEATGAHANAISALGQNLTLTTYMAGPKVSRSGHRLVPYGEALFGAAHGSDSYFPTATSYTTSATSFALSVGGGLEINLSKRFAIRAIDAQYLRTEFPNGAGDKQNHLMFGAGIVVKFGSRNGSAPPPPPRVAERPSEIQFSCDAAATSVEQGKLLEIVGHAPTQPDQLQVTFAWATSGGRVEGTGRRININTTGLATGNYTVTGEAALVSSPTTRRTCEVAFRVIPATPVQDGTTAVAPTQTEKEHEFHENVADALFDYDSYAIRPDALKAIVVAAVYLEAHPSIHVVIAGYSDERGSAEYNLALGEKRANAARDGLIAAGVSAERLKIISYGKETQTCTADNEACWQQNRRAAFGINP
jgi:peptidoglycan-associated lipoprotein